MDKRIFFSILFILCGAKTLCCQEHSQGEEQIIENTAMNEVVDPNNIVIDLDNDNTFKYDINTVSELQLSAMQILTLTQIKNFILYRRNIGKFISLYELQAVPGWDIKTIKTLIHRFKISETATLGNSILKKYKEGTHSILYRTGGSRSDTLINGKFQTRYSIKNNYRQLIRYSFSLPQSIQWGITIEKDAGEKIFADHFSSYLAFESRKTLRNIIIGDYTLNIGQGLIQWQGYSIGLSNQIVSSFRQGSIIRAHKGTEENKYHKGIGLMFEKSRLQLSFFASNNRMDGNLDFDSLRNQQVIRSFQYSGIHMKHSEIEGRKKIISKNIGGSLSYKTPKTTISLNHLSTFFNVPIIKREEPYNYFSMKGNTFSNSSISFSSVIASAFTFGEMAMDKNLNKALVMGLLKSLDPRLDLSIVYRNISPAYRGFQSNAFTQNSEANNERGQFISANFRINSISTLHAYSDYYCNKWPQYFSDGIRRGQSQTLLYSWDPKKKTNFYVRLQRRSRNTNMKIENSKTNALANERTANCRIHFSCSPLANFTIRQRVELSDYRRGVSDPERGFISYIELIYNPIGKAYSISSRITTVETGGYDSRIYAYERDVLSYYSIPALYNTGQRNYFLFEYKLSKQLQVWLKWIHAKNTLTINKNDQSKFYERLTNEWRVQFIWKT